MKPTGTVIALSPVGNIDALYAYDGTCPRGVNKFSVAQIDAYMREPVPPGIEEDQVAFFELVAIDGDPQTRHFGRAAGELDPQGLSGSVRHQATAIEASARRTATETVFYAQHV